MTARHIEYLQLVTRYQAALYGYIRSLAPGLNVDDVLQETNVVLWEKAADFEVGSNFKAFAFRVAHFKTLEALRAEKRRRWLVFDSDLLALIAERHMSDAPDAADSQDALRDCMMELEEGDRELLHQRYTLCKTVRDIARTREVSEGALQQLFFRLRNILRLCIERQIAMDGGER